MAVWNYCHYLLGFVFVLCYLFLAKTKYPLTNQSFPIAISPTFSTLFISRKLPCIKLKIYKLNHFPPPNNFTNMLNRKRKPELGIGGYKNFLFLKDWL